ncbi:MAG: hypothetical protein ACE37K_23900 [Planctomycetota bacterium]
MHVHDLGRHLRQGLLQRLRRGLLQGLLPGLLVVTCSAQEWSGDGYRKLGATYAEWSTTLVDANAHGRVLHMRLWLAGPDAWTLWTDQYPANWTGDLTQPSVGWHDCGVQEGIYWDADGEVLRCRPLASVRRDQSSHDRDPALAGALLQLGHFLWGGGHLAVVLGEAVGTAEGTMVRTSQGCAVKLAPASLTIEHNPHVPEQAGVTYAYTNRIDTGDAHAPCWSDVRVHVPAEPGLEREMHLVDVSRLTEAPPWPRMVAIDDYTYRLDYERQGAAPMEYVDTTGSSRFLAVLESEGVWREARVPTTWRRWLCLSLLVGVSLLVGMMARNRT